MRVDSGRRLEAPDAYFADPMEIVDRDELDYEYRLDLLQSWLSRLADGRASRGTQTELEGAILALQARSKLKVDTPEGQPDTTTYGGSDRSNLRAYGLQRMLLWLKARFRGPPA
ncbi:hypothetical protein HKCCE3408_05070 [Rhodobacterales bacterium HKCCE3408]|nr:hypothetical protein [Rhodobacterales bacterium HKCCE3408]